MGRRIGINRTTSTELPVKQGKTFIPERRFFLSIEDFATDSNYYEKSNTREIKKGSNGRK
jgi:hypothetical protein